MSSVELEKNLAPDESDLAPLHAHFHQFVQSKIPNLPAESEDKHFLFSLKLDDRLIGGICGSVYWDGLEIDTLWVDDRHRGRGHGRRLVIEAEAYARELGAVIAFLKTVEAIGFYQGLGYEIFGILEDRPIGTQLFHMKKRLDRQSDAEEQ